MRNFFLSIAISFCCLSAFAQQPLPDFKVSDAGKNKVRIEWINPYNEACIQLNIQRSLDSVTGFTTVFASISPELPRNGYVDEPPSPNSMYYRIFYVLSGGAYYFTDSKKMSLGVDDTKNVEEPEEPDVFITIRNADSVIRKLTYKQFTFFRDSIISKTRDTLVSITPQEVLIKYFNPENIWVPSQFIFTNRDGNVKILLADAKNKKYRIEVFDENKKHLFTLNKITDTELTLEKVNFMKSGWFFFELYEDNNLKEKNKFYIGKDFEK